MTGGDVGDLSFLAGIAHADDADRVGTSESAERHAVDGCAARGRCRDGLRAGAERDGIVRADDGAKADGDGIDRAGDGAGANGDGVGARCGAVGAARVRVEVLDALAVDVVDRRADAVGGRGRTVRVVSRICRRGNRPRRRVVGRAAAEC